MLFGKQADVDLKVVNAFNRVRSSRLAIDRDGDLCLDYSAFRRGGVTAANIQAHAELFRGSIKGALAFKPHQ